MLGSGEPNGPDAFDQLSCIDRTRIWASAIETSDHGLRGLGLPGSGFPSEFSNRSASAHMGRSPGGGEVERSVPVVGSEELVLDLLGRQLNPGVERLSSGGGAEQGANLDRTNLPRRTCDSTEKAQI